jgi:tetratricopeptide (TPR) repeat protein
VLGLLILCLLAGGGTWVWQLRIHPRRELRGLDQLLAAERYDEAEASLREVLREVPDDTRANLLMAQVALARTDQKPELALRHLARIRVRDPHLLAVVRLNEGKAYSALGQFPQAERSWQEALRLDPLVPEAGWALLGHYYVQGRRDDAHDLAMRLYASEPDPHDRASLLLELLRQDAKTLVMETLVPVLRPVVREHPEDVHSGIALGRALISSSQADEGLAILSDLLRRFPQEKLVWTAYLSGLSDSFRYDELKTAVGQLPARLAADPRIEKHRGSLAQSQRQWNAAVVAYRRGLGADPFDGQVLYRLCQTLRAAGRAEDAGPYESRRRVLESARNRALRVYEEANAVSTLGTAAHTDLYHRLAELRSEMGRPDEALAWHQLVLEHDPNDTVSRVALERAGATKDSRQTDQGAPQTQEHPPSEETLSDSAIHLRGE